MSGQCSPLDAGSGALGFAIPALRPIGGAREGCSGTVPGMSVDEFYICRTSRKPCMNNTLIIIVYSSMARSMRAISVLQNDAVAYTTRMGRGRKLRREDSVPEPATLAGNRPKATSALVAVAVTPLARLLTPAFLGVLFFALLRVLRLVPRGEVESPRYCYRRILSPPFIAITSKA